MGGAENALGVEGAVTILGVLQQQGCSVGSMLLDNIQLAGRKEWYLQSYSNHLTCCVSGTGSPPSDESARDSRS